MKKERITIEGDRYLIYYTFDDEVPAAQETETPEGQEPAKRQGNKIVPDSKSP